LQEQEQLALQQAAAEAELEEAGLAVGEDGRRTSNRRKVTSCRLQPLVGEDPEQARRGGRARAGWEGAAAAAAAAGRSGSDGSGWGGQPTQPRRSRRASADVAAAAGDDPDDSDYTGERRTSGRRRQASCRLQPLEGSRSAPPRSQQLSRFGLEQQRQRQWQYEDGTPDLEYEEEEEEEGLWEASLHPEEEGNAGGPAEGEGAGTQGRAVHMSDGRHLQPSGEHRRPDLPPRPPSSRPSSPPLASYPQQQQPPDVSSWLTEDERRLYALSVPARAAAKAAAAALAGPRPTLAVPRPQGSSRPRPRSGGVKRPWQPRAAPNERNWDEVRHCRRWRR
jgi:hypothetical protein